MSTGQHPESGHEAAHLSVGREQVIIAEKVAEDDDEDTPVKYFATNKIDTLSADIIASYGFR